MSHLPITQPDRVPVQLDGTPAEPVGPTPMQLAEPDTTPMPLPGLARGDADRSGQTPDVPDPRSAVDRLRAHAPDPSTTGTPGAPALASADAGTTATLDRSQVLAARREWKDEWQQGKRPLPASATRPDAKQLEAAIIDVDKSARTFTTADQVKEVLDHHLLRIGPLGRELQNAMYPGRPNPTGGFGAQVTIRPPRSNQHERVAQLLKHISQLVFASVQGLTQEIESLYVNGVLVIAGNHKDATTKFVELAEVVTTQAGLKADSSMLEQLVEMAVRSDRRKLNKRLENAAAKVANLVEGKRDKSGERPAPDADIDDATRAAHTADADDYAALAQIVRAAHVPAGVATPSQVKRAIETGSPQVLFMHGTDVHAEQQLVRILVDSSVKDQRATIRGTKRPCFGCYLALEYARRFQGAEGLDHGTRPGGFWLNSCQSAHEFILENPGAKTVEEAHAWVMDTARAQRTDGVYKTRSLSAGRRDDNAAPYVAATVTEGDADAASDSDSEADESSMSAEFLALVNKLRAKPAPKPRSKRKGAPEQEEREEQEEDNDAGPQKPAKRRKRAAKPTKTKRQAEPDDADNSDSDDDREDDERDDGEREGAGRRKRKKKQQSKDSRESSSM